MYCLTLRDARVSSLSNGQSFLSHGHFSLYLLLATFIPILKDKLGSINNSKNYRSIAISSLVMKLFDWIFLLLYEEKLELDDLQYAYQQGCSTTMCSWSVIETIDYFIRNGSQPFVQMSFKSVWAYIWYALERIWDGIEQPLHLPCCWMLDFCSEFFTEGSWYCCWPYTSPSSYFTSFET